jgi:hypothetical protein
MHPDRASAIDDIYLPQCYTLAFHSMRISLFTILLITLFPFATAAETKASKAEKQTESGTPEALLKQGMTTAQVTKIMGGAPQGISPMESPEGKAEIWTYRRVKSAIVEPVVMGYKPITATVQDGNGNPHVAVLGQEPIVKDVRTITEDVIQLLIFNGCYVNQKSSVQKRKELM